MKRNFEVIEGEDYVINEDGTITFTSKYLLKRGTCCQSGCKNCPYGFKKEEPPPES
jgi:hypothetical protein